MQKVMVLFALCILGSVIGVAIDQVLGVSFKDTSMVVQIAHKVTYIIWGGLIGINIK